jgi:hypothetical protein
VRVQCAMCPTVFDAKRLTAKYCSTRCRTRASRAGMAAPRQPVVRGAASAQDGLGGQDGVEAAAAAELATAGRTASPSGQSALALARRIDAGVDSGAAMASMVRELRVALADALRDAAVAVDPLDELKAKRDRRAAG